MSDPDCDWLYDELAEVNEVLVETRAELAAEKARGDRLEKDALRYQFCQHWGFPVRNQTAHDADHVWVATANKRTYYGCTPSFAIDAALGDSNG